MPESILEKEKEKLFKECYDLIQQDRILLAGAALSALDAFGVKDFFDFCNIKDKENGKAERETVDKFTDAVAKNL